MVAVGSLSAFDVREAQLPLVLDAGHVSVRSWRLGISLAAVALALQERRVNKKAYGKLNLLAATCAMLLKDRHRQSLTIWRGDMWAIIGAHHDISRARAVRKKATKSGRAIHEGGAGAVVGPEG